MSTPNAGPPQLLSNPSDSGRGSGNPASSMKEGSLSAEVLSVYDLPFSEPPLCVTMTAGPMTVKTGPPLARHKDRNSFRFSAPAGNGNGNGSSQNSSSVQIVGASLRDLYKSTVTIRVVYANQKSLETMYDLNQLRIHESKWLILSLTAQCSTNTSTSNALAASATADTDDDVILPTLRIKLTLSGPYRPEIATLVALTQAWFGLIDGMEDNAKQAWQGIPKPSMDFSKIMVVPAVPLVATVVVASPVIAAVVMVALPFLLPVVLLVITLAATVLLTGGGIFFSTRIGRDHLGGAVAPLVDSLLYSRAGQTLIYDTGPRPTPVSVAKQILPTGMMGKLVVSLLIDLVGSSSYLLPVVGEGLDIAWAPIQTILIMAMYDGIAPNLKYVSFAEEILPFTDIVPSASIGFLCEFVPQLLGKNPELAEMVNALVPEVSSRSNTPSTVNPYR